MSDKTNKKVEELMKESSPTAQVIKNALASKKKEEEQKQEKKVLLQLNQIEVRIQNRVQSLRDARAIEKARKKDLSILVEAQEQFLKDADYNAFLKATQSINYHN